LERRDAKACDAHLANDAVQQAIETIGATISAGLDGGKSAKVIALKKPEHGA
jgi:hypothetical protein